MAILASEAFCTHLIFCNISISFQTNSCWHQKMIVRCLHKSPSIPGRIYQFVTSPRLIVVVNQPLTDGRGIISIFQHTSGKTAAKKKPSEHLMLLYTYCFTHSPWFDCIHKKDFLVAFPNSKYASHMCCMN